MKKKDTEEINVMRLNRFLAKPGVIFFRILIIDTVLFLLWNWIYNILFAIPQILKDLDHPGNYMGLQNILPNMDNINAGNGMMGTILYTVFFISIVLFDGTSIYKIRTAHADVLNVGQKGTECWTTEEEIKQQYKAVPDKDVKFPGSGGTIVAHFGGKLYLDESPVNNLCIGITRSGKDECYVYPSIDEYSRAENQPSLVINDPKMESYKSSKKTLEMRGYDVYFLNLDDPVHSMGFNPLTMVIDSYKKKDYANAELLANSFSFSVFNSSEDNVGDKFFVKTATALSTALILAMVEDCLKEDELVNEMRYRTYRKKRQAFDRLPEDQQKSVREQYQGLQGLRNDLILSHDLRYLPPECDFGYSNENEKKINMYSILNTFTELARQINPDNFNLTALDAYFTERPMMDRAKMKYSSIEISGARTKGNIFASMMADFTIFTYENVAKMTAESTLDFKKVGFGERPIALFMGIPDYDKSTHFLASVLIRQLYFVLAKEATNFRSGKCSRAVKFILNEFGNMPMIEGMQNIITVCLGRNISFDLFIQAFSQVSKLYGDDADTIIGNCGNQIYMLTNDEATAEKFSKILGKKTRVNIQRSGEKLSAKKTFMESVDEEPLMTSNQLMRLLEGEVVINRTMKRSDLNKNAVRPNPIFNSKEQEMAFPYRYQYLTDSFPNPDTVDIHTINTEDRTSINLAARVWDFNITFQRLTERKLNNSILKLSDNRYCQSICDALETQYGADYERRKGISMDIPIPKLIGIILEDQEVKLETRKALVELIESGV